MINGKYWMKSAAIVLFSGLSLSVALAQEKKEVIIREVGSGNKETLIILEKKGEHTVSTGKGETFDLLVPAPGGVNPHLVTGGTLMQGPGLPGVISIASEAMPFESKVVKGLPYSADAVNEFTQTLPDGNRIQRKSETQIYRDHEGRTRREFSPMMVGMMPGLPDLGKTIQIVDPVAGTTLILNPQTRTANKLPSISSIVMTGWSEKSSEKVAENTEVKIVANVESGSGGTRIFTRRVEGVGMSPKPAVGTESGNAAITRQFTFIGGESKNVRTENLGKQTIEGIEAEGTRTVTTIPAGEVGNEKPIEILNERWYSNELQMVVLTRHLDPRFGENVYRVVNLNRAEPDAALFVVPADYKVKDR
jgi:hypothetical protein